MASQPRILKLLDELRDTTASIYFVPDMLLTDLIQARMDDINGIPVVAVCETPFHGVNGLVKRLEDVIVSAMILLAISPLMLAIALAVKLTSPGPLIFRQRRYGLDGKEIIIYKFRTMTVTEDGDKQYKQVTKDDDRVTRFGAFLRKTSLDELPQFINVLQGRMSIVGPRPHAIAINETVPQAYSRLHGPAQGQARNHGARADQRLPRRGSILEHMRKRIEFDLQYLRNWSLQLDIGIMLRTALIMLRGRSVRVLIASARLLIASFRRTARAVEGFLHHCVVASSTFLVEEGKDRSPTRPASGASARSGRSDPTRQRRASTPLARGAGAERDRVASVSAGVAFRSRAVRAGARVSREQRPASAYNGNALRRRQRQARDSAGGPIERHRGRTGKREVEDIDEGRRRDEDPAERHRSGAGDRRCRVRGRVLNPARPRERARQVEDTSVL